MANQFKNATIAVNTTPGTVLYTVPNGRTAVIHALYIANTSNLPQSATIELIDASNSVARKIVAGAPIPVGGSLSLPKVVNLESGDAIRIVASTAATLEATASILEIS